MTETVDVTGGEAPSSRATSTAAFWTQSFVERDETFAWLRAHEPVSWQPPFDDPSVLGPLDNEGRWVLTRAEDIHYVSHNYQLFSARRNLDPGPVASNFMGMDPPEHTLHRNIISSAFTPKAVAQLNVKIEQRSRQIVDDVIGGGRFDFVERVSSRLPMLTVGDIVGVPESQLEAFTKAGNDLMAAAGGDELLPEGMNRAETRAAASAVLAEISLDTVRYRRTHPAEDVATALALGQIDGHPISDAEVMSVISVLAAAGNDTTKNTTSWTLLNLIQNPEQKAFVTEDFDGRINQAVEEFIRYATVVNFFPRLTVEDTVLGGQEIKAGQRVFMYYCSGNRDESLFPDPHRFDVSRPRTNHVAFGGRGAHHCLGNVVARAQLRALFRQILTKLPDITIDGEPQLVYSHFLNAVKSLPVSNS